MKEILKTQTHHKHACDYCIVVTVGLILTLALEVELEDGAEEELEGSPFQEQHFLSNARARHCSACIVNHFSPVCVQTFHVYSNMFQEGLGDSQSRFVPNKHISVVLACVTNAAQCTIGSRGRS